MISSTDLTEEGEPRAIRFIDPPDYESPGDANRDNVYKVTLVAKDGAAGAGRTSSASAYSLRTSTSRES